MKEIEVVFEKVGDNGVSIGKYNGKIVFAYGVIPGEKAKILIKKEKKNFIEGELIEIIEKSKQRIASKEEHYLSCSPWQTFCGDLQIELKKQILKEILEKFKIKKEIDEFYPAKNIFGYRTKIEFSFIENSKIEIGFHKRGDYLQKIPTPNGCLLIDEESNKLVIDFINYLNSIKIKNLKSLILRRSVNFSQRILCLLIKDKKEFKDLNYQNKPLSGLVVSFSNPKSPASNFDEILKIYGQEFLKEKVLKKEFLYSYNSFFQNNLEMFELALKKIIENTSPYQKIVDLYSGVGVIGISLSQFTKKVYFVETEKRSIEYTKLNCELNDVKNFEVFNLASEKLPLEVLEGTDLLILDPPRAGLHKKLIKNILQVKPKFIFYLSCNPLTQVRDYSLMKDFYKIEKFYVFDFYPNTPHIESLMILKLMI